MSSDQRAWLMLSAVPGVGGYRFQSLLRQFGSPEAVLDALLGKGPPSWDLVASDDSSEVLTIVTRPEGAALSAIVRIIEQVAPEALRRPINYAPVAGAPLPPPSRLLH